MPSNPKTYKNEIKIYSSSNDDRYVYELMRYDERTDPTPD